jgi:hypothetical protein
LQTDQVKGEDLLEISFRVQRFANLFSLSFAVGGEGKSRARGQRCQTLSPLPLNSTSRRHRPPTSERHPAKTLALPRLAETDSRHPTPTWPSPCPPWTPQRGQRTPDHRPIRHFATSLVLTPGINST